MAGESPVSLSVSHRFSESPERVFDAWLDPGTAGKWLFAAPTARWCALRSMRVSAASLSLSTAATVRMSSTWVRYLELDRPRRLVFSFVVPRYSQVVTRVAIDIAPTETGCELTLTHDGVAGMGEPRRVRMEDDPRGTGARSI